MTTCGKAKKTHWADPIKIGMQIARHPPEAQGDGTVQHHTFNPSNS